MALNCCTQVRLDQYELKGSLCLHKQFNMLVNWAESNCQVYDVLAIPRVDSISSRMLVDK